MLGATYSANILKGKGASLVTRNIPFIAAFIVLVWLTIGTVFYTNKTPWPWHTAFFYSVNAGMNVGFGNLSEPNEDSTHIFTIFLILSGSSIISGSIIVVIAVLTDFDHVQLQIKESNREVKTWEDARQKMSPLVLLKFLWYKIKYLNGWYSNPARVVLCYAWLTWIILGALFWTNTMPGQTFISGLFFAISGCASGGLYAAPCADRSTNASQYCDVGIVHELFTGCFLVIGVPLHAVTWAQFGSLFLNYALAHRKEKKLWRPITMEQFKFASTLMSNEPDTLNLGEFTFLELWRLGKIKKEDILSVLDVFRRIDAERKGLLSVEDLVNANIMEEPDSVAVNSPSYKNYFKIHEEALSVDV